MASETIFSKCSVNEDQSNDSLECADSRVNDSSNRDNLMSKSWSPDSKIIRSEKCYCSDKRFQDSPHLEKKHLYKTYSSYGFKNLNKNRSRSHWSLADSNGSLNGDERNEENRKRNELAHFQRCMKLLGLNVSSDRIDLNTSQPKLPNTKTIKPKVVTRLKGSSLSIENIHEAILQDLEKNHSFDPQNRSFLARAVYEKWYHNKLEEQRKQQKEKELKNELLRMEFERMRCEQKLKAEKSYKDWIQKKKFNNESSKPEINEKNKRNSDRKFLSKNSEKEYMKWKNTKNEEYLEKKQQWKKQKQHEIEDKERRKTDAEKAYRAWLNRVSEELKKKYEEKKKQMREQREEENRNKLEKEKEANTSFNAWKQNKLQQLKQFQEQQKFQSKLKTEARSQRIAERLCEAEQAFYEWLDSVDKRINSTK